MVLDSPIHFRSSNSNKNSMTSETPATISRESSRSNGTMADHQALSKMLGGTAAYPSLANPQLQVNGRPMFTSVFNSPLTPPSFFDTPRDPPQGLPLRELPQTPEFKKLDEHFNNTPHIWLGPQGRGHGYNETLDETVSKEALAQLEKHIADRAPYVQLASKRLQAATELVNENTFDLPTSPTSPFGSGFPDGGRSATASARGGRKDSGIGLGLGIMGPGTLGMHVVDKDTGRGLREFLLQKGKEQGSTKRECRGISFHDFTPEIRTLRHQNVLLAHYGADGTGERIDTYEVNLPSIKVNEDTGAETQVDEPWLWILISRPIISFNPNSRETYVPDPSEDSTTPTPSTGSTTFYTPQSRSSSMLPQHTGPQVPPPNFPSPLPNSWLVFAAPLAHLTSYPETTEQLPFPPNPYPFMVNTPRTRQKIQKRKDYDFSHHGLPIFEFSSASIFTSSSTALNFLSVDGIGPWSPFDDFAEYTDEEYSIANVNFNEACQANRIAVKSKREVEKDDLNRCGEFDNGGVDGEENGEAMNYGIGVAPPNKGIWWKVFYQRMYEDRMKWIKIRKAMGRGKCRVVVRWNEWKGEGVEDLDVEMLDAQGLEAMKKKGEGKGKRITTRSETRRRSGLGNGAGGGDQGAGMLIGDIAKARAMSNLQAAGTKEKGKGKKR